jgi:hypothetical protein
MSRKADRRIEKAADYDQAAAAADQQIGSGGEGITYITVSARYLIVRAPIRADGSAGPVEPVWRNMLGDDFAFGESGSLYVTTHPAQTLVRY